MDPQRDLEEVVAWYAPLLGLQDWAIECRWNGTLAPEHQAEVSRDPVHRAAILTVSDQINQHRDRDWDAHTDHERSTVHELVHVAMVSHEQAVTRAVKAIPDKRLRKEIASVIDEQEERFVDAMARALLRAAYADRATPTSPAVQLVPRSDQVKGA